MDLMNRVVKKYLNMFVMVFINEILTYLKSEDDHANHLRILWQFQKDQKLFAKLCKCVFFSKSMSFHVHIVSKKCIENDSKKTDVVKSLRPPLYLLGITCYLVLDGHYICFMEGFSLIYSLVMTYNQKKIKLLWYEA